MRNKTGGPATEDLLDQMVQEERLQQRARKELYREQLQREMEQRSQQKQQNRKSSQRELEDLYKNMQRAQQLEREKYQQRVKIQREVQLANEAMLRKGSRSPEAPPDGKSLSDQLNEHNQLLREARRQRQGIQDQMNIMQEKVLQPTTQIKRQQEQKLNSELRMEEQLHLQQMENYIERREHDKQNRLERHRQNMRVYEQIGRLQGDQEKQKEHIQERFETDKLAEMRLRANEEKSEEQRRRKEQLWRRGVQRQLDEMKQAKQSIEKQKLYERKIMDSINIADGVTKNTAYLQELEKQIAVERNRRQREHNERYGVIQEAPTRMSPALLGKVPSSHDRQKQLEVIDRGLGFFGLNRSSVGLPLTPGARIVSRQEASQQRELRQLQDKLNASRSNNVSRSVGQSGSRQSNRPPPIQVEQIPLQMPTETGLQSRSSARSGSSQLIDQPNHTTRSVRMYDFITGRNRVYNVEQ